MGNGEANQRLFFALWPAPELQQAMAGHARRVLEGRRARFIPTESLHLTLAFLGEVDADTRQRAEYVATGLSAEAFTLIIDRMGYWARRGLLWAGPAHPPPGLEELASVLGQGLQAECGLPRDKRAFRAHLTLARKVPKLPPRMVIEPLVWPVERFVLVASELDRKGPTYTLLREWPLPKAVESER